MEIGGRKGKRDRVRKCTEHRGSAVQPDRQWLEYSTWLKHCQGLGEHEGKGKHRGRRIPLGTSHKLRKLNLEWLRKAGMLSVPLCVGFRGPQLPIMLAWSRVCLVLTSKVSLLVLEARSCVETQRLLIFLYC